MLIDQNNCTNISENRYAEKMYSIKNIYCMYSPLQSLVDSRKPRGIQNEKYWLTVKNVMELVGFYGSKMESVMVLRLQVKRKWSKANRKFILLFPDYFLCAQCSTRTDKNHKNILLLALYSFMHQAGRKVIWHKRHVLGWREYDWRFPWPRRSSNDKETLFVLKSSRTVPLQLIILEVLSSENNIVVE